MSRIKLDPRPHPEGWIHTSLHEFFKEHEDDWAWDAADVDDLAMFLIERETGHIATDPDACDTVIHLYSHGDHKAQAEFLRRLADVIEAQP